MAYEVQQCVWFFGDALRKHIERGQSCGVAGDRQYVIGDIAEGRAYARDGRFNVEMLQTIAFQPLRAGYHHQGSQSVPSDGRKAPVGNAGQIEGERRSLHKGQEVPVVVKFGTQALPSQSLEVLCLNKKKHA